MATITFDTLKFAKKLQATCVPSEQAEAMAEAFRDAQSESEVVTRKDLQIELAPIRTDLMLIKWMLGVVVAAEVMPLVIKIFS